MGGLFSRDEMTPFRERKLMHEFETFFDVNKNGKLEWKDFDLARTNVCEMGGWKPATEKYIKTDELFKKLWTLLQDSADENLDGVVSKAEWLLMWKRLYIEMKKCKKQTEETEVYIPKWLENYIEYKFNMYDRTGDGEIDGDEFEYVLGDFGVAPKEARTAFLLFSQNNQKKVDPDYFRQLTSEYFFADEPSKLGNFITGRLDFIEDETPVDEKNITAPNNLSNACEKPHVNDSKENS